MRVPTSTYRLQLNAGFTFAQVRELIDYFEQLGVGDLYLSPVFQARPKSPHGYDVTNPGQFNREVGDEAEFETLSRELRARGIGVLLDIVPNHMAASEDNPWWRDILEHGPASLAAHFFDVDWDAPGCNGRIVLPVLGKPLPEAIAAKELVLKYHNGEIVLGYFARALPLDPATYALVLNDVAGLDASLLADANAIPPRRDRDGAAKELRRNAGLALKQKLFDWAADAAHRSALEENLSSIQGDALRAVIDAQAWKLEFWRTGAAQLNYRRFFDITDLAGVRVEESAVFATTHSLILELIRTDQIDGVRIDHVDGLRDPYGYLMNLRAAIGDAYVIVEKILAPREELRESWPVEGTTGYDFTGLIAGFYCEPEGLAQLTERYERRTGMPAFAEIVYQNKKLAIDKLFAGELRALTTDFGRLAEACGFSLSEPAMRDGIREISASLEVYRTYITDEIDSYDRCVIKQAVNTARHRATHVPDEAYALLRRVLLGDEIPEDCAARRREFVFNWQQFTGPVMAKGLEDTSFYSYNRMLALSEVGAHPDAARTSVSELHDLLARRAQRWPYTLNASSTHDTKRSEDVRARIQVLTELPDEWQRTLDRWLENNARHRQRVGDALVPHVNEEIMIYQTLLGVWPLHEHERATLGERMQVFLQKAAREAKLHSSWLEPNEAYEQALFAFTNGILRDEQFLQDFSALQETTAWFGALNSLSQLVLKLGAPGIPDIYQGNESWLFSLVDPDNRRPVDFAALTEKLAALGRADPVSLLRNWQDGRIKLHVTREGLRLRRQKLQLFANGEYIPLEVRGRFANHVVSFARRRSDEWALVVTGRFYSKVGRVPLGRLWGDTQIQLPPDAPQAWRNVLTGEVCDGRSLECSFATLPFAILLSA